MLTPQEITDKVFVKAVFGGYDMTGVDDFLEAVCADYTALYKENAILKGKLKVLVEKVEEYRSTEDAMRMALLTAQRMGEEITTEANKQKEEILHGAEMEAKARLSETARRIADEELRLSVAAKETAKFIELSQAIMRKHTEFLAKLEAARRVVRPDGTAVPQEYSPPPQPQQAQQQPQQQAAQQSAQQAPPQQTRERQIADAADYIGNVMDKLTGGVPAPAVAPASAPHPVSPSQSAPQSFSGYAPQQAAPPYDDDDPTKLYIINNEDDTYTPRPKFDFDDLKFGSNFNAYDDKE